MSSTNNQNNNSINSKPCAYGCNTRIFWNIEKNEFWETFTQKRYVCPNRTNKATTRTIITTYNANNSEATRAAPKPTYYNKK